MTTITDSIRAMMTEAAEAGDILQAAICAAALDESWDHMDLDDDERARVEAMTRSEARQVCAVVLRESAQ